MDIKQLLALRRQAAPHGETQALPCAGNHGEAQALPCAAPHGEAQALPCAIVPARRVRRPASSLPAPRPRITPCSVPISSLPEEAAGKARERLKFVLMVRAFASSQKLNIPDACELVRARYMENFPILSEAGKHGVCTLTYHSYRNWSPVVPKSYTTRQEPEVLQALADGYQRGRRDPVGPPAFFKYLCAVWLSSHRLPMTQAYDVAVKRLRKDDPSIIPPTIYQAKYYLSKIDKAIVCIGRDGGTAFRNMFIDYIDRDWSAILPGDMVVGDSRTFDTRCKVFDEKAQKWVGVRPTICALLDAASNYFAAWTITPDPVDAASIANTLALYCYEYGAPPRHAYFDNGKDYTARGFSTPMVIAGREFSVFQSLGITMTNSIAYNARAKTIEREFANMMRGFDKAMPDYLGSKPGERTMDAEWYDRHPEDLPTLQQFIQAFSEWLRDFHNTPQKSIILENRAPADVWNARPQVAPLSQETLAAAFRRPVGLRHVVRGPAVQLSGRRYFADELKVSENVVVKLDPVDDAKVHCYTPDGAFIATAVTRDAVPALADAPDDRDLLSSLLARQRRQMKQAITALNDLTGGLHLLSPYELLNAPPEARLVPLGTIGSVKGTEHTYTKVALREPRQAPTPPPRPAEEPSADPELQKLINEARHSFDEDADHDIFASLAATDGAPQEDAAPAVSPRSILAQEE